MPETPLWIHFAGWLGTALILGSYTAICFQKMESTSWLYHWMNLTGAVAIAINVTWYQAWPSLALEAAWGTIAILSLKRKHKIR